MRIDPGGGDGKVVGIQPFQTGLLADRLDDASKDCGGISGQLSTIYDDIITSYNRLGIRLGPSPHLPPADRTRLDSGACGPLDTVASQAPGLASDIRRRVQMLYDAINGNNSLDPRSFFLNAPPPSLQTVNNTLQYFKDHIDDSGPFGMDQSQGAAEVYAKIKDLAPADLEAFLAKLTPDQLKDLNTRLGEGFSPAEGLPAKYVTLLSAGVPIDVVDNLRASLTNLHFPEPALLKDQQGEWKPAIGTLFGPNGIDIKHDLMQGGDGDCWFLSSLAAISERDPHYFESHIKQNPDGTYTAIFYDKNGNQVPITVDNKLPYNSNGNLLYAQTPDNVLWVAMYEKAYTVFRSQNDSGHAYDTYDDINGGWESVSMQDLTGVKSVSNKMDGSTSLAAVAAELKQGHAVATTTDFNPPPGQDFLDPAKTVVAGHVYSVENVDLTAHPPTVTLINPWGGSLQEITLTEDQWKQYFCEYATNPIR